MIMSQARAVSAPELSPSSPSSTSIAQYSGEENISGFEGVATNVKLLLKLIQDHNGGITKDNLERKHHRVAGMISIIDEVKNRIQKIQTNSKRRAELRRCNTDVKPNIPSPREKKSPELVTDEKDRLRRELQSSMMARQSIQALCSSLGKEKQIMAAELARKAQELTEMEEYISDLKDQNQMLMEKLQACSSEHREKSGEVETETEVETESNMMLQQRNKELSEQLLKSIDGYRYLRRKFQAAQEENMEIHTVMEEMEVEVQAAIEKIQSLKGKMEATTTTNGGDNNTTIKEEIAALEQMLRSLSLKISKHRQKKT
ncbi:intracellular protein transport protein USO1-like [Senna tora]|uniref:Intracellular protein transport protein USO1-like n=1 Tax=Senna tora TaxID=362788 RepID=A0A834XD21_9FABA|nr:intracellular protein transport protein USO1-like [Senna tora]